MIEGKLFLTDTGRYAIHYGKEIYHELTSGDVVEVLIEGIWETTRVECSMKQYYFVNGYPIDSAIVRID